MSIMANLCLALLLGSLIGLERQWKQTYAGLSTHALVALGAAAYTSLPGLLDSVSDPARLGGQVVTGIGFLGAGVIMRDGLSIRGLSAAATVWATGSVGVLSGYGLVLEAAEVAGLILLANLLLPRLGILVDKHTPERRLTERLYVISLQCPSKNEALVREQLLQAITLHKLRLRSLESHTRDTTGVEVRATVYSTSSEDAKVEQLVGELSLFSHIFAASWSADSSVG